MITDRVRVAFVLTSLTVGGAEMMLWKLVSRMDRDRFEPLLIALSAESDAMLERFTSVGVQCRILGIASPFGAPGGIVRLRSVLRAFRPHLVQGWLYHGNLAATLGSLGMRNTPVLWSIRGAPAWNHSDPWSKRMTMWAAKQLSPLARRIIHNSMVGAVAHESLGFDRRNRVVLPNGFDTEVFRPCTEARSRIRAELGLGGEAVLIGLIGRFDPMKDHPNFLRAAALLKERHPNVCYVLVGGGAEPCNTRLTGLIEELGLRRHVRLLGLRDDMHTITAALDLSVLSSTVEGFPNVIGEAMSCGVPCVVTDVGDCRWIVGETGRSVPARDSQKLADAMDELIALGSEGRAILGSQARQRIIDEFGLDTVVRRYQEVYEQVCRESHAAQAGLSTRASV